MRKQEKKLACAGVLLAVAIAGAAGGCLWWKSDQVFVDGHQYRDGTSQLDLRDRDVALSHYQKLREKFPDREILWNVPFQKRHYENNTKKITVTSLTEEDAEVLAYLTELSYVDASNCFDYEALKKLRELKPDCQVESCVAVAGQILPYDVTSLEISEGEDDFEELMARLPYLENLEEVSFTEPQLKAEELKILSETFPLIEFTWEKTLFRQRLSSQTEELDISGMKYTSVEAIEAQTDYLPGLKKLIMCDTGLFNEDIAAFRERSRDRFKVIWNVKIRDFDVRTDAVWFKPSAFSKEVRDCDMRSMKYCEDMLYVDMSRHYVKNIDWVKGTPHLKYLVVTDSPLRDIQALRYAKELKLLDLSGDDLRDLRPLMDCTALEDLTLAAVFSDLSPVGQMDWLKNLRISREESGLEQKLSNTAINGSSWKQLPNYKDMQKLMELPGPTPEK